jgi:uncharacterized protein YqiB (DUF1249 family)
MVPGVTVCGMVVDIGCPVLVPNKANYTANHVVPTHWCARTLVNPTEAILQTRNKKAFKLDLRALHAICEANYARMMRLFPEYETANLRRLEVGSAQVTLEVVERCRYTTIFRLRQKQAEQYWLGQLLVEVRAYHDAAMLEVGMFQSHRRIAARYQYPNDQMFQQDEKFQQNVFLAEWLEHCLANGRVGVEFTRPEAED